LSVGAVYDSNAGGFAYGTGAIAYSTDADRLTPFSQRHEILTTVFAPGAPITGAGPTGGLTTYHGTSQASPHIAGIAVLAQQLAHEHLGRRLTVNEFAALLQDTTVHINDGDDENDNVTNTGLDFPRVDMLALGEAILAMRGDPLVAWDPNPTNGSTPYIKDATPLSWSPGDMASQHDVYFGTDKDAVDNADASDTTGIYRGRQGVTSYSPPEGVELGGGPYYWRIDEYNTDATISKGSVWSFTVADFIVIDDIEGYTDYPPYRIFDTWIDGWGVPTNGSIVGYLDPPFVEQSIVHGGSQSMPYFYENNFKYSEATMTLVWPRDWTEEGVGVLSLWFYGDASNAAERIYFALNGSAVVYHDNPNAAQIDTWTEWTIDLQEFAVQGVNLANVNTISIGFGDKNNPQAGGSGLVFFDDICLYRPAPPGPQILLSEDFEDGDYNGWSLVDQGTIGSMAWSAATGVMVQSSNVHSLPTGNELPKLGTYAYWQAGTGWTDYTTAVTFKSDDNDTIGVMFRYQDENNYYRFSWDRQRSSRRLVKCVAGQFTLLAEDSVPYVIGQNYQLKIVADGNTLQVSIDGSSIFSVNDSSLFSGTIALYNWGNIGSYFDDIVVEST